MRKKMTIDMQISHMEKKGIKFDVMSKEDAKKYLAKENYYFKLKSYAKSFEVKQKDDTYLHLDFAYLVELAELDKLLKNEILTLSLEVEHLLKVKLNNDITNNDLEDGYHIVELLLKKYPFMKSNLKMKINNSATSDLILKYGENLAAWNIVEVLSFGEFIKLYELYYATYDIHTSKIELNLLWSAKFLRNATAHDNCLLNTLRKPYIHTHLLTKDNKIKPSKEVISFISKIPGTSRKSRIKKIRSPIIHDFIALLCLFDTLCENQNVKKETFQRLHILFNDRFTANKDYFIHEDQIISTYQLIKNIIDYLLKKSV